MILSDFVISSRQNLIIKESGIDSLSECRDQQHFKQYPYQVEYSYNSRGFRDLEWPDNLNNVVWCLGDSFTAGIGSAFKNTWPQQLSQLIKKRCINVSLDGASNTWISRRAVQILNATCPQIMVIQWSYLERIEDPDTTKSDEQRRLQSNRDSFDPVMVVNRFEQYVLSVEQAAKDCQVIHSFIPHYSMLQNSQTIWDKVRDSSWPEYCDNLHSLSSSIVNELKELNVFDQLSAALTLRNLVQSLNHIPEIVQLDRARDGYHYDLLTAQKFARDVASKLCSN